MSPRPKRLVQDAMLLLSTDQAMLKEGFNNLDDAALQKVNLLQHLLIYPSKTYLTLKIDQKIIGWN